MTLHTIKLHAINISLSRMILSYNSQLGIPSALASIHRKCHNAFFLIVCTKNKSKTLPSLVIYMFLNQITAKHNAADTCIDPAPFLGLFRASRGNLTLTYHMWAHPSVESIDSENISLPYLKHGKKHHHHNPSDTKSGKEVGKEGEKRISRRGKCSTNANILQVHSTVYDTNMTKRKVARLRVRSLFVCCLFS